MRFGFFFQLPGALFRPKRTKQILRSKLLRIKQHRVSQYRKLLLQRKKLSDNLKKSEAANARLMAQCTELKTTLANSEAEFAKLFSHAEGLQVDVENWEQFCDTVQHERSKRKKQRKLLRAEHNAAIAERDAELAETHRQLAIARHNYSVICDVLSTSTIVTLG